MSYEDVLIRESVGDGTIDPDDVCMVCDKRDCVCPPEEDFPVMNGSYPADWPRCVSCGQPALDGHLTCGLAGCNEGNARDMVLSAFLLFCVVQCVAFAVATVVAT